MRPFLTRPILWCSLLLLGGDLIYATQPWIAGYTPLTFVGDVASIDLDAQALEKWLDLGIFQQAQRLYEQGGYAKSYALLKLVGDTTPEPPQRLLPAGTLVYGTSTTGQALEGRLAVDTIWEAGDADVTLEVEYDKEKNTAQQQSYCQVGGLDYTDSAITEGCFIETGFVQVIHLDRDAPVYTYAYEYDIGHDNRNGLTIQSCSTENEKTRPTFGKYFTYYGLEDFGNHLIMAAFHGHSTNFTNGNMDFHQENRPSRSEAIKVATKFMNIWMKTISMMEEAIENCQQPCQNHNGDGVLYRQQPTCDDTPIRSWDQAAALYAGSLEGESGSSGGDGVFLFNLADEMCSRFQSCGTQADLRFGTSYVNNMAIEDFMKAQIHILKRECGHAKQYMQGIVKLMAIPLVQATLYTTYERIYGQVKTEQDAVSLAVQGTSFVATILPLVHDCNPSDAQFLYESLLFERNEQNETTVPDYTQVKLALERNYQCMGISCRAVGGISMGREYFPYAEPCQDDSFRPRSDRKVHIGFVAGLTGGVLAVLVLIWILMKRFRSASVQLEMFHSDDSEESIGNLHPTRGFD